jgi:WD40 repeat protein
VWGASFARDVEHVVTLSDQTARIWNTASGAVVELTHNDVNAGGIINSADLSPDGRWLATGYQDGSIVIWDLELGRQHIAMEHEATVWEVTFSRDGKRLASASADRSARIWSVEDGRELTRVAHDDEVKGVAFSRDGARLATASADGTVRVWSVNSVREQLRLEHGFPVRAVEFTRDGALLASLGDEQAGVQLWNSMTGYRTTTLEHKDAVGWFGFSPDGRSIATASLDGSVATWDIATGKPKLRLVHEGPASGAAYSADGSWLVTWGAWEKTARIWEVATGIEVARVAHDATVTTAEFSPDGRWLLTASEDHSVRVWKWRAQDVVAEICARVTRNLTPDEWRRFVGEEAYRPTCPKIRDG